MFSIISFVLSSMCVPCCSEIPSVGILMWPTYCVQNICSCMCMTCTFASFVYILSTVVPVVIFFSIRLVYHCGFSFLLRAYVWTVLLDPFISLGRVAAAAFRFQISTCRAQIWSSCCLNLFYRLSFIIVRSVKTAFRVAVADTEFMKSSSVFPCFILLALVYPAYPFVCLSSSLCRYSFWKCVLNRTYVWSLAAILFHMRYACLYSCVARVFVTSISSSFWLETVNSLLFQFLSRFHPIEQDINWVFNAVRRLHLVLISHEVSRRDFSVPHVHPIHQLHEGLVRVSHYHIFFSLIHCLLISATIIFLKAMFMFLTRWYSRRLF